MSSNPKLPSALLNTLPWNEEEHSIWIGSSLILRRNLARYNFPSKLQETESAQVLQSLENCIKNAPSMQNGQFFSTSQLSSTDRELIFEHFLFLRGFQEPPNNSGMVIDENGETLALLNTGNHLEIHTLSLTNQWESSWNKLAQIENHIGTAEGLAFSPKFGYLTADPSQCGTGLTVQAYLHLPALIHANQLDSALANTEDDEVLFMGISGDLEELVGDLLILQNNFSIGISEEAILHTVQTAATKLIGAEKTMRSHLKEAQNTEIKDQISKAFGVMVHSFQMETKETLDLLSLLKLGLALGYISGVSDRTLSELFFKCRRGYFSHLFPDEKDPQAIAKKRADFLQEQLRGITLSPDLQ